MKRLIIFLLSVLIMSVALADEQAQSTQINLISPVGVVNDSYGHPLYQWEHVQGATGYEMYLASTFDLLTPKYYGTIDAATYCNATTCEVDLTTLAGTAWLSNGSYTLFMNPDPGNVNTWIIPGFTFDISEGQPEAPTTGQVSNTNTLRPTISWTLPGLAEKGMFFELYVARADDLTNPAFYGWVTREQTCGSWTGTTCSFTFSEDLGNQRTYNWYIHSWGAGGLSYGGVENTGWSVGDAFLVNDPNAPIDANTAELLDLINAERKAQGMGCLAIDLDLVDAAYKHSVDMRNNNYFSHTSLDGSSFGDRIRREGYDGSPRGENIAAGYSSITSVYTGWFNSSGHYKNMFNSGSNEAGLGIASGGGRYGTYYTLVTGRDGNLGDVPCP